MLFRPLFFWDETEAASNGDGPELHDAVFVVGALDETMMLRGMRYHPIDVENSVLRCHKKISECAVFTWTNLLVVVVELDGNESEALDLVPLVTSVVLEEHQLVVGVVVVVDPGVVPINSRGEKQRMHLRDGFLADQLDPIYVAYNIAALTSTSNVSITTEVWLPHAGSIQHSIVCTVLECCSAQLRFGSSTTAVTRLGQGTARRIAQVQKLMGEQPTSKPGT
ncbi:hypothetical protein HPB51_025383 [Rhipicephalus microplus]|uniref:AMP-binding enzyme C-terminal domain-containing protein n=1 Tax=Rhipicephalus microplus TaxID=6941 RepID=A0A9J6DDL7_RHIMP|nr:hypothetical protein HPB51_025383 [Rhipicephalus microplus]